MAILPFAKCLEAASAVDITPEEIGVNGNDYVRKKDLASTGKFDEEQLQAYGDNDYVRLQDIAVGIVSLSVNLDTTSSGRGTVQINSGTVGPSSSVNVNVGDSVTVKCDLTFDTDVFDGWYNGSDKVSSNVEYTFNIEGNTSLTAKILYLDVSPTSLDFESDGGTKTLTVDSNV